MAVLDTNPLFVTRFSIYRCRDMGFHILSLLHAIIPCLCPHDAPCFYAFWHFHFYILQHLSENVFVLFHWFYCACTNMCINIQFSCRALHTYKQDSYCQRLLPSCLVQVLPTEYNRGSSCLQQLVVQRKGHKVHV